MSIWSEFLTHEGRLIHKWTHYVPAYERHFGRFVNRPFTFIEIGCGEGGSLQMWKRYFGPLARIIGVDIDPRCKEFEEKQIEVRIGDQSDTAFLASLLEEFGEPDVVLDDGSHIMENLAATFRYLYPKVQRHGVYMVEDLHTAYWPNYGGGYKREGTFIELCKGLIDELNAETSKGAVEPTEFTRSTVSMHFYDSLAVFERGQTPGKHSVRVGGVT